jgi:iron complex outermembrane recepter protein
MLMSAFRVSLLHATVSIAALLSASPQAQAAPNVAEEAEAADAAQERAIIVTAPFTRDRLDVLQATSVLTGDQLSAALRSSIGETLAGTPGASSTSFGPGASRPVLRGLQGERVRVLSDGIGSIDVSNTSVDHAAALDPLVAERIEVLRGPATLLYGSSAVGGVVNAITTRLPSSLPEQSIKARARTGFGSAADEFNVAGAAQVRLSSNFGLQFDASYVDAQDLRIGSFAKSARLRALEGETPDPDEEGKLENSDLRTFSFATGALFATENLSLALTYSRFDSNYGIPPGSPAAVELLEVEPQGSVPLRVIVQGGGEEEDVRIDIVQDRVDFKGALSLSQGFVEAITLRAGYADYSHAEIEGEGEVGTIFNNEGVEARLELVQRAADFAGGSLKGAFGVQFTRRDFEAIGEESFVPPNITRQYGFFALQTLDLGRVKLEAGARLEAASAKSAVLGIDRDFTPLSLSAGTSVALNEALRFTFSLSRSERAPAAEELFANGPHAATGSFEIGDPGFKKERALGLEAGLRAQGERFEAGFAVYFNRFDNFISERATGDVLDDLPVFQFTQGDAEVYGAEFEAAYTAIKSDAFSLRLDLVADVVRGRDLSAKTPLPRIPAARARFGVEALTPLLDARVEVESVANQRRITTFELPTDSYTLLNATLRYRPFKDRQAITFALDANNIFDVDARRHASFLKDSSPLAGRDIRVRAELAF